MSFPNGITQTVLGPLDGQNLGRVLCHEHLSFDGIKMAEHKDKKVTQITKLGDDEKANLPFVLENMHWIAMHPYSHRFNLVLSDDQDAVAEDLIRFRSLGGGTVVENTTTGIGRVDKDLISLSRKSGVHIIAGTGFYVHDVQAAGTLALSQEGLEQHMNEELFVGVKSGAGFKCGVIGELGCSWPLHDFEKRVLRAAATIQSQTKVPVIIHPGRDSKSPQEIMDVFLEAGGLADRTVMSHLERTLTKGDELGEFLTTNRGLIGELDLFGIETSYYQLSPTIDMPSDAQRIALLRHAAEGLGLADFLTLSHDIHTKHRLTKYGGHGFGHLLENAVPKMLQRGITQESVDKMLISNPRRWLTGL